MPTLSIAGHTRAKAHPQWLRLRARQERRHNARALQANLGHHNIQHTVRYTELSLARFKDLGWYERHREYFRLFPDQRCDEENFVLEI